MLLKLGSMQTLSSFHFDERAENFYVLLKGQVRVTKKVSKNKETAVAHHDEMVEVVEVILILKGRMNL